MRAGIVLMIALLLDGPWASAASILGTRHNLSPHGSYSNKAPTEEVCIYCHTPHTGDNFLRVQGAPLWSKRLAASGEPNYIMYKSPTFEAMTDTMPSGVSRTCLSCHDGTVGINQFLNDRGTGLLLNLDDPNSLNGTTTVTGALVLGTDLRDDHPISMQYTTARSTNGNYQSSINGGGNDPPGTGKSGFNSPTYILSKGLKLFDGDTPATDYVQCASCHDPHDAINSTFLRLSNTNSALCLTCHNKDGSAPQQ